jgi:hypothetical protein
MTVVSPIARSEAVLPQYPLQRQERAPQFRLQNGRRWWWTRWQSWRDRSRRVYELVQLARRYTRVRAIAIMYARREIQVRRNEALC